MNIAISASNAETGTGLHHQNIDLPAQITQYPEFRYMGSKRRLLPWIFSILNELDFETALDPFSGSGTVSYLMKAMGRRVVASDFLNVSATIAEALIANNETALDGPAMQGLLQKPCHPNDFISRTFAGVFFEKEDLAFLDRISANLPTLDNRRQKALAIAALARSCLKRQPRGVFTIAGDLSRYDDGRRDLHISIEEHFLEQTDKMNAAVFSNNKNNISGRCDVFESNLEGVNLVYLDPPYVPRSDDNCYIKRYHFIEGLSCYWKDLQIIEETKVKKFAKRYTPFSYRRKAECAFDRMFSRFKKQKIVLSYSSNGYPDLDTLIFLMKKYKADVRVHSKPHLYHFGTHANVKRARVEEYLLVGL